VVHGAAADGAVFTDVVAVADLPSRRLRGVRLVLRGFTVGGELKYFVALADRGVTGDDHVRPDPGPCPDGHIGTDDAVGTDHHVPGQLRARGHDRPRIDHGSSVPGTAVASLRFGATMICACATSSSSTSAAVASCQMPRRLRS